MRMDFSISNANSDMLWTRTDQIGDYVWRHWGEVDWCRALGGAPATILALEKIEQVASVTSFELPKPVTPFTHIRQSEHEFQGAIVQLIEAGVHALQGSYTQMIGIESNCLAMNGVFQSFSLKICVHADEKPVDAVDLILGDLGSNPSQEMIENIENNLGRLQEKATECVERAKIMATAFDNLIKLGMEIQESKGSKRSKGAEAAAIASLELSAKTAEKAYVQASQDLEKAVSELPTAQQLTTLTQLEALSYEIEILTEAVIAYEDPLHYAISRVIKQELPFSRFIKAVENLGKQPDPKPEHSIDTTPPPVTKRNMSYEKAPNLSASLNTLLLAISTGPDKFVNWDQVTATDESGVPWARINMELALKAITARVPEEDAAEAKQLFATGIELCRNLEILVPTKPVDKTKDLIIKIKAFAKDATSFCTKATLELGPPAGLSIPRPASSSETSSSSVGAAIQLARFKVQLAVTQQEAKWVEWRNWTLTYLAHLKDGVRQLIHFFNVIQSRAGTKLGSSFTAFKSIINGSTKDSAMGPITLSKFAREMIYLQALGLAKNCCLMWESSQLYVKIHEAYVAEGVEKLLDIAMPVGTVSETARTELNDWGKTAQNGISSLIIEGNKKLERTAKIRAEKIQKSTAKEGLYFWDELSSVIDSAKEEHIAKKFDQQNKLSNLGFLDN
ncbi:hypothetical protein RhiXN_11758 [Rhizoctonia solani]|uniref:Uncharacterized protein n=1 Tax=Rhizoctonia solani TaxID=456999 RepID=A0A8H8P6N2_9AGAM|nr:uncharacterized protein RhiXN_11758 [Rhizoctonia solani]QRW24846.1 hypothetical protein RhiXN_11758 [Rhizoctonia solani]